MQRFRGGLVFKAHRLVYHSTLGLRVIKKKKKGLIPTLVLSLRDLPPPSAQLGVDHSHYFWVSASHARPFNPLPNVNV